MIVISLIIVVLLIVLLINVNKQSRQLNESFYSILSKLNKIGDDLKNLEGKSVSSETVLVKEETKPDFVPEKIIEEEIPSVVEENIEVVAAEIPETEAVETILPETEKIEVFTESEKNLTEPYVQKKSWFETFKENNPDLEKFIGENLINKIGILILVLGVSYFVKFAIDKDWINEPARVGIGILAGSLVMAVAHKLKQNFAAFSSVLVAGAISIFYFTIAIAFHEYHLFSQTVAFAIMAGITTFSVLVSVSYNRQELAVLSLIGGFAVPFMVSTGQGNYVVLFTYIAILNIGILAISYFKKWNIVTLLSFIFTTILFIGWCISEIGSETFSPSGALLFATLFYVIFSVATMLQNLRKKGTLSYIEYAMLIVNNFVFFGLGMTIINDWGINIKGLFTLLLAIYNLVYAYILYTKFKPDKNSIYVLIGLTLTFATLTIPIQFKGNQITLFWTSEAVLLFWLAQKSKIQYFKIGAIIVQVLTFGSLLLDWMKYGYEEKLSIVVNPLFIAGIFVTASLVLTYFLLKKETEPSKILGFNFNPNFYRTFLLVATVFMAYFTGFLEALFQSNNRIMNSGSSISFPVAYHFAFLAVLITVIRKIGNQLVYIIASIIVAFSIFLYIVVFYRLTNIEIVDNLTYSDAAYNYAFYLHYVIAIAILYLLSQLFNLAKSEQNIRFLSGKIAPWLFVFAIVYVLSCELLIHGLYFNGTINTAEITKTNGYIKSFEEASFYEREIFIEDQLLPIKQQIIKIGYPILWGVFSFVFLIIGIQKQWKRLRIIALSLLGLTILKLFVYDINNTSETGRIIAFILLGVLILIISFVYQKLKKLVIDDEPKTENNEN
ncbi:MAG: DUF2339 domain-containing protein [Xanthomarina gelatinilytica]|uniref:DUF2339 domain-containing protein n=1 Tax=Xanthomarina gelatinilytica TaxID=1137281 RepID=UPI003A88C805